MIIYFTSHTGGYIGIDFLSQTLFVEFQNLFQGLGRMLIPHACSGPAQERTYKYKGRPKWWIYI